MEDLSTSLCAALLAEACNIGLEPVVRQDTPALTRGRQPEVHSGGDTSPRERSSCRLPVQDSAPRKEVEAESTAFVVCHALGLDTASFALPYVATWANGDVEELAAAGENVRRASLVILDALQPPRVEAEGMAEVAMRAS